MFATIRALAVGFAVFAAASSVGPMQARATSYEQLGAWCMGEGNVSEDVQINSCTEIINSGQFPVEGLNQAYFHRAYSYAQTGRYDLCVADLTSAISYWPQDATAYWVRHMCKQDLGDIAGAEADKRAAKSLDPAVEQRWEAHMKGR